MKRLLWLLLLGTALGQGSTNQDILPSSSGLNLGHNNQRWNGYFQNIDISGTCTINGAPSTCLAANTFAIGNFHLTGGALGNCIITDGNGGLSFQNCGTAYPLLAPAGSTNATSYSFTGCAEEGIYDSSGSIGIQPCSTSNIVNIGSNGNTIQLIIQPNGSGSGDAVLKLDGLFSGVTHQGRIVYSNSLDALTIMAPQGTIPMMTFPNVANGAGPVLNNTGTSGNGSPFVIRATGGTAGSNETWLYHSTTNNDQLDIVPQHGNGTMEFVAPKFTQSEIRVRTNDGFCFAAGNTGCLHLNAADGSGLTTIEADNDSGIRLRAFNHTEVTQFGTLKLDTSGLTITGLSNCVSSASPAVCAAQPQGFVAIPAASATLVVNSTAVTANSIIRVQFDETLGTALSVTCNTAAASEGATYFISARTAATSFTIKTNTAPTTNPACISYTIYN